MKTNYFIVIAVLVLFYSCTEKDKSIRFEHEASIDSLFQNIDSSSPGFAVGVIKDGNLVFSKGYGMANLEYNIPITSDSKFAIGSVSKQFTAACIYKLIDECKVDLEEDIRIYIPDLPDFGHVIKVKHLIHHHSGLWDYMGMIPFMGIDTESDYTNADCIELVKKQHKLNFTPGDEFSYSNSNYLLLAEIVERVSGTTLREYANSNLFIPLGMSDTHFYDNSSEVLKNKTTGYVKMEEGYFRKVHHIQQDVGAVNIVTTINDLYKWDQKFLSENAVNKNMNYRMYDLDILNNGDTIPYGFGLWISNSYNLPTVGHGGGQLGYKSGLLKFPNQNLCIIILSNMWHKNFQDPGFPIAKIVLSIKPEIARVKEEEMVDQNEISQPFKPTNNYLDEFQGIYYNEPLNVFYRINQVDSVLELTINNNNKKLVLQAIESNIFTVSYEYIPPWPIPFEFKRDEKTGIITEFELINRMKGIVFKRVIMDANKE